MLVSAIHQHESAIDKHVYPPSWTFLPTPTPHPSSSHWVVTEHSVELPESYRKFSLAIYFFLLFSCSVISDSLGSYWLRHARLPCSSLSPRACLNSCPLSLWCCPTISSSVVSSPPGFSLSRHQGFFQWVDSSHQVTKVSELQLQNQSFQWIFMIFFMIDWLISLQSKGLSKIFSNTTWKASILPCSVFFMVQLSYPYMTTGKTIALTIYFMYGNLHISLHSSVLAWRIPGTGEPGGLPSMGSHRDGHAWSNLAAVAAADRQSWGISGNFGAFYLVEICFQSIRYYYTLLIYIPVVKDGVILIKSNHQILLVVLKYFCKQVFLILQI